MVTCFLAGAAYLVLPGSGALWVVIGCCAIVSLMTDIGNPSLWAIMQDTRGRNTGSLFWMGEHVGEFWGSAPRETDSYIARIHFRKYLWIWNRVRGMRALFLSGRYLRDGHECSPSQSLNDRDCRAGSVDWVSFKNFLTLKLRSFQLQSYVIDEFVS